MIRAEEIIHPVFAGEGRYAGDGDRFHSGQLAEGHERAVSESQPDRIALRSVLIILRCEQVDLRESDVAESKPRF